MKAVMAVRLSGTEDKIRVRFFHCGQLSEKIQDYIAKVIWDKWEKLVTIVRWPRNNIVELKLSQQMIRSAGFLEITQELGHFWEKVIALLKQQTAVAAASGRKNNC